jgi:hypothetical protein
MALASYAYLGFFSRYVADDYCFAGVLRLHGFWRDQAAWYTGWTGRFSIIFAMAVAESVGVRTVTLLPALALASWLAVLIWLLWQLALLAELSSPISLAVGLGIIVLAGTLFVTPNVFQSLYWQSNMFAYTAPLIAFLGALGMGVYGFRARRRRRISFWWAPGIAFAAFVAGGFSETNVAVQILACFMAGIACHIVPPASARPARFAPILSALAGSLAALLAEWVAPGNAVRNAQLPPHPAPALLIAATMFESVRFVVGSRGTTFARLLEPFFGTAILLLVLRPFHRTGGEPHAPPIGRTLRLAAAALLCGFLLVAASVLPTIWAYGPSAILLDRVRIVPAFIAASTASFLGWLLGETLGALDVALLLRRRPTGISVVPIAILLLLGPPSAAITANLTLIPALRLDAQRWDARDRMIRDAARRGEATVTVPVWPSAGGLLDIGAARDAWITHCAEDYYGIRKIRAVPDSRP